MTGREIELVSELFEYMSVSHFSGVCSIQFMTVSVTSRLPSIIMSKLYFSSGFFNFRFI